MHPQEDPFIFAPPANLFRPNQRIFPLNIEVSDIKGNAKIILNDLIWQT